MTTGHRVAYLALGVLACAALLGYVTTVVMVVLELSHPVLGATQGPCFICMSPWVQTEFLIGLVAVLLILVVSLACLGTSLARRDLRWSLVFFVLLVLFFGLAVLTGTGFIDAMVARFGVNLRTVLLFAAAACALLIPLLALRYARRLRLAWTARAT